MATPETRTGQIEAAALPSAKERQTAKRFIRAGWWTKRYRELSWAWRFNLAALILASLNAAAIRIGGAFDWDSMVTICTILYGSVVFVWFIGSMILIALSAKEIFASPKSQLPSDTGNDTEQYPAQRA